MNVVPQNESRSVCPSHVGTHVPHRAGQSFSYSPFEISAMHKTAAPLAWHLGGSISWLQVSFLIVVAVVVVVSVVVGVGVVTGQLMHSRGHETSREGTEMQR